MRKTRLIFGIFALSLASTSCLRQKTQPRAFSPPPVKAQPKVQDTTIPNLPDAPRIAVDEASIVPPPLPENPDLTNEIPEAPKRIARRPAPVIAPPKPAPQGPVAPEPVAPKLAQMFTPEELRENTRALDESLDRVNRTLVIIEGKTLTAEQKEIAERIRTFRKQAEQAREQDLLTAVSLARRADLLAKDLLERLP